MDLAALKQSTLSHAEHPFVVCRGDHVDTIKDLANCIDSLSVEQFRTHVDETGKNHFAIWIAEELKNPGLARDLNYEANLKDKLHFVKTIRDHVAWLEHV